MEDPPIITSATQQHTQYNGRTQPVEARAAKDDIPSFVITYFTSEKDLENNKDGSTEAPVDVGDYYVRIERPAGNGYRQGKNIKIEYHIQKAFISIIADPVQRFVYDGRPKEALVYAEPAAITEAAGLVISYFAADNSGPLASPPSEKGHYRVVITFPGNARYMGASKEIELFID